MSWWWVWCVAGAAGVAILAGLRWALADLLLDQFGSLPDSLTRVEPSVDRLRKIPGVGALSGGRSGDRHGRVGRAPIRAHRRCRCGLLPARHRLASAHRAATVERRALVHDQARHGDAALHAAGRAELQPLTGGHVAGHPALDDDRGTRDLRVHHRALADGERLPRGDLPLNLALYPRCPLEHELAVDLGYPAHERIPPPETVVLHSVTHPTDHLDLTP